MKKLITTVLVTSSIIANAALPMFHFQALTPTDISITRDQIKRVVYKVSNYSTKPHSVEMKKIIGVTESRGVASCIDKRRLEVGQSCVLDLKINGNEFRYLEGKSPSVCAEGSPLMCYAPSEDQLLRITVV